MFTLLELVELLLWFYGVAILARTIFSWLPVNPNGTWILLLTQVTDSVLQLIRRYLPRMGGLDLSPLAAIAIILVLLEVIRRMKLSIIS
jgi:YggT family protein